MKKNLLLICLLGFFSCKPRLFRIPSSSMEETIMAGQSFFVTPTDKFERDDIVVFDYFGPDYSSYDPENPLKFKMSWSKRVFRIIAYSGDYVEIIDGEVFINHNHISIPPKAKLPYEIFSTGTIDEFADKDPAEVQITRSGDTIKYFVSISQEKAFDYEQRKPTIISVKKILPSFNYDDTIFARTSNTGSWTPVKYGPFKIPSPGDTIIANENNFKFYKNIPNIKLGMNIIKEKLYFVLGDNRYNAEDSRYIGLISHSKMYGVVKL